MHVLRLDSTSLDRVDYNPSNRVLLVVFRDRSSYRYYDVPATVFEQFREAPSKGAYFNHSVRGTCSFLRVRGED